MIVGELPFKGDDNTKMMNAILVGDINWENVKDLFESSEEGFAAKDLIW